MNLGIRIKTKSATTLCPQLDVLDFCGDFGVVRERAGVFFEAVERVAFGVSARALPVGCAGTTDLIAALPFEVDFATEPGFGVVDDVGTRLVRGADF